MTILENPYQLKIEKYANAYGIPVDVYTAMIKVESNFDRFARSRSDARGLTQVIYRIHQRLVDEVATRRGMAANANALYDEDVSLECGARHLAGCYASDGRRSWERAIRKYHLGSADPPKDAVDGQGTSSDEHIRKWRAAMDEIIVARRESGEEPTMPTYRTNIPGLPGGPLETSFPVRVNLVSASMTRNRPGLKLRGAFETTQHMTANDGTLAPAEANYLRNGAGGRQASWHATIDDSVCEITLPFDEVGWHGGDGSGPGNMSTVACELTQQLAMRKDPVRWRRARRNAAELLGKTAARKGGPPPGAFHQKWSGKNCPAVLLANPTWVREYHEDYRYFYDMERAAMQGQPAPGPDTSVIRIGDTLRAIVRVNLRQQPNTKAPVIVTLDVDETMTVNGAWTSADGYGWLPVQTGDGNGYVAQGNADGPFVEKVAAPTTTTPAPQPQYADRLPVDALLATDLRKFDTAEGIVFDDEAEFIFVADVIEFTARTRAMQYAPNGPSVKADYPAGERAIAAWLVKAADGKWYYLLAGGDDEWVRVPYATTKRVSDAPLLGDDTE